MLENEKLITLTQAIKAVPSPIHPSAAWRWMRRGILARNGQRIYLEGVRAGGRLLTSSEAVTRFFSAVAVADAEHFRAQPNAKHNPPSGKGRQNAIERARAEMGEAGL